MKEEIAAAATFICKFLESNGDISKDQQKLFQKELEEHMAQRFSNHWHPRQPSRGQAYRCIRFVYLSIFMRDTVFKPVINVLVLTIRQFFF